MSKLNAYIRAYGRPFRLQRKNGKGIIRIYFYDGYVTIKSIQPGARQFDREIHIVRSAWDSLINSPKLDSVTAMMEGPDFDRYRAERVYAREESRHLDELRAQKRERKRPRRKRRRT